MSTDQVAEIALKAAAEVAAKHAASLAPVKAAETAAEASKVALEAAIAQHAADVLREERAKGIPLGPTAVNGE